MRGLGELLDAHARRRDELGRHPVAVRDRAGLVEQQHVDVARGLDRAAAHRDHVLAHQPIHAGDPDRREQAADRRRDQAHEQRDDHRRGQRARPNRSRAARSVTHANRNTIVSPTSRMCSAISFGVFCRAAPSTSAIILSRNDSPGFGADPHDDPIRQDLGAAGDRRAIAAGFADHRRRLAGDRRLVDRRDALDDLAVAGDHLPASTTTRSPLRSCAPRSTLGRLPSTSRRAVVSPFASCAASRPAPCRGLRRPPRRSSRTAP